MANIFTLDFLQNTRLVDFRALLRGQNHLESRQTLSVEKGLLLFIQILLIGGMLYADDSSDLTQKNSSEQPKKCACNLDIFASALYWYTTETVDWAYPLTINGRSERADFKTISFDWGPGFRLGIGYHMKHDQWDTQLYYTQFHTQATDHASSNSGMLTSAFLGNKVAGAGTYQTGKIKWDLRFNIFDWELGRRFLISKALSIRPLIGLKGGWIHQNIHTKWENLNFLDLHILLKSKENLKNNFQGVGPRGGIHGKWMLGNLSNCSFSLFGDFAAAYMWGHWNIKDRFRDNFQTKTSVKVGNRKMGAFMIQGFLGIGLDFNAFNDRSHFTTKLGYEIQDWFDQYQVLDNLSGAHSNDLILQGATLDFNFNF